MSQSCLDCAQRFDRVFCDLEPEALGEFDEIKSLQNYPRGTPLFREGQAARGVFLVCGGRVRLSVCSESGRRMTLRVAGAGEILGLSAALAGGSYEVTAEVVDPVQTAEVRRKDLLQFLHTHPEVCLQVVNVLSDDLHEAYGRVRTLGMSRARHQHTHSCKPH